MNTTFPVELDADAAKVLLPVLKNQRAALDAEYQKKREPLDRQIEVLEAGLKALHIGPSSRARKGAASKTILEVLKGTMPDGMTPSQIQNITGLNPSTLFRNLQRLKDKSRVACVGDYWRLV